MGNPDRPELQDELAETFCRTDPEHARVFARRHIPLGQPRRPPPDIAADAWLSNARQDAIAPREVGAYVHAHIPDSRLVTLDATGHCPHVSAPDGHRLGDRRVRPVDVTDCSVEDFWENAPSGHVIAHPDGRIIRVNATAVAMAGIRAQMHCAA